LRRELVAAEAAERLETQLVAGRAQLATVPVAGSLADPQAGALARLMGLDEGTIRTGIALLLAALVEAGSALGFTVVTAATAYNPPPLVPSWWRGRVNAARYSTNAQRLATAEAGQRPNSPRRSSPDRHTEALERWLQTRLTRDGAGRIPAREAYADYCRWARAAGIEPGTETRFGRDLTARIGQLGGTKAKCRDRAYYQGVSLVEPSALPGHLWQRLAERQRRVRYEMLRVPLAGR
jgi:hypothetical protein